VESSDGTVLWSEPEAEALDPVLSPSEAFVVLDALEAVVDRGTGAAVRSAGYYGPAAGKTGTTNEGRDAWFIGLTPDVVAGVWIGFDQPREIVPGGSAGALAAPAWGSWMQRASAARADLHEGSQAWTPPEGVERVRYDPSTGEVLGQTCTRAFRSDFPEAWVIEGHYEPRACRRGVGGWLDRVWHTFVPERREPLRPLIRSRPLPQ
jgi:penicillin-binding protein 1A